MKKVAPGQPVEFKASTWNAFVDAARYVQGVQSNLGVETWQLMNQAGLIVVRNDAGVMMNQFCLVALNQLLVNTYNNPNDFFYRTPVCSAAAVTAESLGRVDVAVTQEPIEPGKMGKAMIFGITPAPVNITSLTHRYAIPDPLRPGFFQSADEGECRILWSPRQGAEQWCLLLVGTGGVVEKYDGPFAVNYDSETQKVKILAGYLSRNGEWLIVNDAEIEPQTGLICVSSSIGDDGNWTVPEVKITTPDKHNYPIGRCVVIGESVSVRSFHVAVAMIIDAAECPVSAQADEGS